jgi:hypothetical protein
VLSFETATCRPFLANVGGRRRFLFPRRGAGKHQGMSLMGLLLVVLLVLVLLAVFGYVR